LKENTKNMDEKNFDQFLTTGIKKSFVWLIFPFEADRKQKINIPYEKGPAWNWSAFLIPELWFLYNEIWGVFFLISTLYGIITYAKMFHLIDSYWTCIFILSAFLRVTGGRTGNLIYYFRHGKWPS